MTNTTYKDLAKFVKFDSKTFGGVEKYSISYTQPNSSDIAKVWNHSAVAADLSDEAVTKLISMVEGDLYCSHRTKTADGFPLIIDITDQKDAVKPEAKGGKSGFFGGGKSFTPKDETGIAVGAAWTNAISLYGPYTDKKQLDEIDALAWDILQRKLAHETKLRAQKGTTLKTSEEPKVLSRAEQIKAKQAAAKAGDTTEDLVDNDLDDVKFD